MRKSAFTLLAILFSLTRMPGLQAQQLQQPPRQLIRVDGRGMSGQKLRQFQALHLDVAEYDPGRKLYDVIAKPQEREELRRMGVSFKIVHEDLEAYAQELRAQGYLDHFFDYERTLAAMQAAADAHPEIVDLVDLGDSWEKTQDRADRDIWALKISDNAAQQENEPEVLIMGLHHSREIITPSIVLDYADYLVQHYGVDPYVTHLVDQRQIWLVPMVNPDGLEYVFNEDLWWRKNRRDNGDGTFGVDLNRNYGFKWGYDNNGSSPFGYHETYRGTAAFSEPESAALRDFTLAHRFTAVLTYHSHGNLLVYPWGYIPQRTPDHLIFAALADSIVAYNNYHAGLAVETVGYSVNGDADDWFYGEQSLKNKVFSMTPEVGTAFHPDTLAIAELLLENRGPNLFITYAAGEEPVVAHQPLKDTEKAGPYHVIATVTPAIVLTQPVALTPGGIQLHYHTSSAPPLTTVAMSPTGSPDEYTAEIPNLGTNEQVYYFISASNDSGRTGHAPRGGGSGARYSFRVGPDNLPPVLTHSPLANQSIQRAFYPVRALAHDNVGIVSLRLFYRQNGGNLIETLLARTARPDEYEGRIAPPTVALGDYFEYFLLATDSSAQANSTRLPSQGYFSFLVVNSIVLDFEPDDGGLTTNFNSDWEWGVPASGPRQAFSGANVWATQLGGNYSDYSDSRLDLPPIDLTNTADPALTFWHWYHMEYSDGTFWDGGNVKISVNGGPFRIITPVTGYDGVINGSDRANVLYDQPAFGGPRGNGDYWHQEVFDLSAYVNQTIVIRFHFGSDGFVTEPGWYLDDLEITLGSSLAPRILGTTRLANTKDTEGPYFVSAQIIDDGSIASAVLQYSTNGSGYAAINMQPDSGEALYAAGIPGQPVETAVWYYVEATDNSGNVARDPAGAPDEAYRFMVTDRAAKILITPDSVAYALSPRQLQHDTLRVTNEGLLDLYFTAADSVPAARTGAASWLQIHVGADTVAGESTAFVPFTLNTDSLGEGRHRAFVVIHSNDAERGTVLVPVEVLIRATVVTKEAGELPESYALWQNRPNPAREITQIRFDLPKGFSGEVKLVVFNLMGQQVRDLRSGPARPGIHNVDWDGEDDFGRQVPAGVYFYRLEAKEFVQVRKLLWIR